MANVFNLSVDSITTTVTLEEAGFTVEKTQDRKISVATDDLIALVKPSSADKDQPDSCVVHYIKRGEKSIWTKETLTITRGDNDDFFTFLRGLEQQFAKVLSLRPKRLLVLLNPVGGRRQAQAMYDTVMTPIFELANISRELIVSQRPKHLEEVMVNYDCKNIDGIVMMGGDGTFAEVINVLMKKTQEEVSIDYNDPNAQLAPLSKPVSIVPTGTGNGLADSLVGCKDVLTTTLHIVRGKTRHTNLLGSYNDGKLIGYSGCIFGTQFYTEMLEMTRTSTDNLLMKILKGLIVPFAFLLKPIRTNPVEITVYSTEHVFHEAGVETIKEKEETFQHVSCSSLLMPWAIIDKAGKFCVNAQDHRADEFFGFVYAPMGKIEMVRHLFQLIARKDNVLDNQKIKKITGYAIKIKFLESEPQPNTLKVSIDGEIFNCTKPEYYVKLLPGLVSAYSSR